MLHFDWAIRMLERKGFERERVDMDNEIAVYRRSFAKGDLVIVINGEYVEARKPNGKKKPYYGMTDGKLFATIDQLIKWNR